MSNPKPCAHFKRPYQIDNENGITCTNCGKQLSILEGPQWKEWVKEHQEILRKINRNHRYLQPIVKVRKFKSRFNHPKNRLWKWECRICYQNRLALTWADAHRRATHHAHNHHGSTR